jgi:iron(III) transport system ATP-binding protein
MIRADDVSRDFARGGPRAAQSTPAALQSVSVAADRGRMLALVGASGSGKTTLLRCIAGLETPDTGEIAIGERVVFSKARGIDVPAGQRGLAMIFQGYALWPHLRVAENVAYPLRRRKRPREEIEAKVRRHLELVGCAALAQRFPHELSGGQQQRIALARALVYEPAVVLFDEPLSNLDAALRTHLRLQIRELQHEVGFTGVYVTHDQEEAFYLGDRIAILDQGRVVQSADPEAIYASPATLRIAAFVGADNQAEGWLREAGQVFEAPALGRVPLAARALELADGREGRAALAMRPECVTLVPPLPGLPTARVVSRARLGGSWEYVLALPEGLRWRALMPIEQAAIDNGREVGLQLAPAGVLLFPDASAVAVPRPQSQPEVAA